MKIAVIGTGISGNVAAYHLARNHDVTVFEANGYVGGHTHTHDVAWGHQTYRIDTGFIVFNDWTYPNFVALLDELGVTSQPSDMSFSVCCQRTGLEYNGTSLNTLFAQRRNILRPSFHRMILDILRFNKRSTELLKQKDEVLTLGQYLRQDGYSEQFINHYVIPMGSAIWSTDPAMMFEFPAAYFVRFLHNHGMLSVNNRPQWRVIEGGSQRYVDKLTARFRDKIRLNSPVEYVKRHPGSIEIKTRGGAIERFDYVFIATHSDQALRLLKDASPVERDILGAIPYQRNEAVLHVDSRLLPKHRVAWAAWNYHLLNKQPGRATLTYNMNILQGLNAPVQFCVTLNNTSAINPNKILRKISYDHPLYTRDGVAAQKRHAEINGPLRTYYCGAYWRFGFHEDGVVSTLSALEHFNRDLNSEKLHLSRAS